jgi:ATP-binding protein involved in chromosome partitioning
MTPLIKPSPKEIRAAEGSVTIRWSDGHESSYDARELRLACRCAACVDEWTRESRISIQDVPGHVKPSKIEVTGNYALLIAWSDGHSTGLYTYDYLREICGCEVCRRPRSFDV